MQRRRKQLFLVVLCLKTALGFSVGRSPSKLQSFLTMQKSANVCVVGGGLAGLVSSKECLRAGLRPTIFESAQAVGGMWNPDLSRCYTSLITNLSRFTCTFSDFPCSPKPSAFPSQAEMGQYLKAYREKFLTDVGLKLGCNVTDVRPIDGGKFSVSWTDASAGIKTQEFDKVIIASGFFATKVVPPIKGIESFTGNCLHSQDYRSPAQFRGKRVAVVGSSFSSAEIAAEIAPVASSVFNIMPRKSWVLPRFLPLDPTSPSTPFIPIDLHFYRREPAQQQTPAEFNRRKNKQLRALFGSGARDPLHAFGASLDVDPPFVGVSDTYSNLCTAGRITPVQGRLTSVDGSSCQVAHTDPDTQAAHTQTLSDIDAIVLCTGFRPALSFLAPDALAAADYLPDDTFCPLRLYRNVLHPTLHGLAFVGMYRGPYFGVTELQARLAAAVFSGTLKMPDPPVIAKNLQEITEIRAQRPRPQFPFPDYVGAMDLLATELGVQPSAEFTTEGHPVIPALYREGEGARKAGEEVLDEVEQYKMGKGIAAVIARSLHGTWRFERQLTSRREGSPSGMVKGEIAFEAERGGVAGEEDLDYLEKGEFTTPFGSFSVTAQYLYCYNPELDTLDVYFGPPDPRKQRLFVRLRCTGRDDGWFASAEHRCGQDDYDAEYLFAFDGLSLREIRIKFKVIGPTKDYTSTAVLTRA